MAFNTIDVSADLYTDLQDLQTKEITADKLGDIVFNFHDELSDIKITDINTNLNKVLFMVATNCYKKTVFSYYYLINIQHNDEGTRYYYYIDKYGKIAYTIDWENVYKHTPLNNDLSLNNVPYQFKDTYINAYGIESADDLFHAFNEMIEFFNWHTIVI